MPVKQVRVNSTNVTVRIRILDDTSGQPETAVVATTPGLSLWYWREGGTVPALTPVNLVALNSAYSDGGILHINNGYYRLDVQDAAFAEGADAVLIGGTATGMVIVGSVIQLTDDFGSIFRQRTLTQAAASVIAAVSGREITVHRGDTLSASITGLGNLSAYVSLDFTVKEKVEDADSAAIIRIRKNLSGVDRITCSFIRKVHHERALSR